MPAAMPFSQPCVGRPFGLTAATAVHSLTLRRRSWPTARQRTSGVWSRAKCGATLACATHVRVGLPNGRPCDWCQSEHLT
eukprot:366453-Chlamydomonas_euryale.AAC.24